MRRVGAVLAILLFGSSVLADGPRASGSVCVAPLPAHAKDIDHDYPKGKAPREYQYDFSVQIDEREKVRVPKDGPVCIANLQLEAKHRVIIRDAGRAIESFSFTFEQRKATDLCLAYGPWYQTWSLEPAGRRKECQRK